MGSHAGGYPMWPVVGAPDGSFYFDNQPNMLDKTYQFDGLKVYVDQASLLYLDGAEVDYVESLEGSGFKFNNPEVKSTCGCGSSFQV